MSPPAHLRMLKNPLSSVFIQVVLAMMLSVVLWTNWQSLYYYPTPNSWIYWAGDETQAMSESVSQVQHGIYAYPQAVGSVFENGAGIIKGSVWLTSVMYGSVALLVHGNVVDVGRTISFVLGLVLLLAVYWLLRTQSVHPAIALCAVLMLASTDCFLIMSHTARPDILISISILSIIGL